MRESLAGGRHRASELIRSQDVTRLVPVVGGLMITTQVLFRAWAVYPAWFFLDDYNHLIAARSSGLSGSYLLEPYAGHLWPGGRLVVWLITQTGSLNWTLAATGTLVMQAVASCAALWMLVVLFGPRRIILIPLGLYLTTALTMPAYIWWSAALTLLPVQIAFFVATATWVKFLRTRRLWPLLATVAAIALGLAFDVKGILVLPVLAYVALAYFASGSILRRARSVLVRYRVAWVILVLVGGAYSVYYVLEVPQITTQSLSSSLPDILATMLGATFVSGILGGPWHWEVSAPPTAFSDPPTLLVNVSWVVLTLVVVWIALRRTRTVRAWVLLGSYLFVLAVLLASTRSNFGAGIGREYRYLTDATCMTALCLGLALAPLLGAVESSGDRSPALVVPAPRLLTAALVITVMVSGLVSSATYARIWHTENASDAYLHRLQAEVRAAGRVDLAETVTPEDVLSNLTAPLNNTRRLAPLVSDRVDFPSTTSRLAVVGPEGGLHRALIQQGVASREGRSDGCGWRVTEDGNDIPLKDRAFNWTWWMRIGYLAGDSSPVTVTAGSDVVHTRVASGVHSLYVRVEGAFSSVRIDGLDPGTNLCVDTIEVGQPVPGGAL